MLTFFIDEKYLLKTEEDLQNDPLLIDDNKIKEESEDTVDLAGNRLGRFINNHPL